jgi:antitoxin MazE
MIACNYGYYMKTTKLKVARIGNSRGVRLPASTLDRYKIGKTVVMEERVEGILLRPHGQDDPKLSWDDTARAMAEQPEDWDAWTVVDADGLEAIPWDGRKARRVAETPTEYRARRQSKPRSASKKR